MPDADHVPVEQGGRAGVVGVVVRIDEVRHGVAHAVGGRHLIDSPPQVVADAGGCVEDHDAVRGGQERRLVDAVGDPVQVPLDTSYVVSLIVEGWAERGPGDRRVVGQVCGAAGAGGW